MILRICLALLLLSINTVYGFRDEGVQVRFLQSMVDARPGQMVNLQVMITNKSTSNYITFGRLDLPKGWKSMSNEACFTHLGPMQCYIQNLSIQVSEQESDGQFNIALDVFSRQNVNIHDRDQAVVVVRNPPPPPVEIIASVQEDSPEEIVEWIGFQEEDEKSELIPEPPQEEYFENSGQSFLCVTSPSRFCADAGQVIFVSGLLRNSTNRELPCRARLVTPQGWAVITDCSEEIVVEPNGASMRIFGVKIPEGILAGEYHIDFEAEGLEYENARISVFVNSQRNFCVTLEDPQVLYPLNERVDLRFRCENNGNAPLNIVFDARGDPFCDLYFHASPIEIPASESCIITLRVDPDLPFGGDWKQFILLNVRECETGEVLCQQTFELNMTPPLVDDNDPYVRIPAHFKVYALGDNGDSVYAVEFAGRGLIDPYRERYMQYFFRLPTDTRNVIFNVDQRMYVGFSEPNWEINIGDTVYDLTPLTQNYRYGRGGGFDIYQDYWAAGAHYTQNTFNNDYNPKELCAYYEYDPNPCLSLACNYLHKDVQETPTSNIVTGSSEMLLGWDNVTELEFGKNFVSNVGNDDPYAYRFSTRGRYNGDTWYNIEKVYAGSAFFGYYQHIENFAATIDFPINCRLRGNFSYNRLKQNFEEVTELEDPDGDGTYFEDVDILAPRQRQFNATFTYNLSASQTVTVNGLLLRAKDVGVTDQYNFYQKWAGFTYTLAHRGYLFNLNVSYGRQDDYKDHSDSGLLQRYYAYIGKDLTRNLYGSLFYEGGSTNYYDAEPWRTSVGGTLRYHYSFNSWFELFLQRVKNTPDQYDLSQVSFTMNHTFSNLHSLQGTVQYYHYKEHYKNDLLFLVSYTIPFGMPVGRKNDCGSLSGCVYDTYRECPVSNAVVNVNGGQIVTDEQGYFHFPRVKAGQQMLKTEILPKNLIAQNPSQSLSIQGGKASDVMISVVPACCIEGEIVLLGPIENSLPQSRNGELVEHKKLKEIRVVIDRDNGKEVYSTMTDAKGRFKFTAMRPGNWRISMDTAELPPFHYVQNNDLKFKVEPEENKKVVLNVVPEVRVIQSFE